MRIGLIGLGRIGTYHAANLVALDEVEQLVVTDAMPAAVASAVERFGATAVDSVEDLLGTVEFVAFGVLDELVVHFRVDLHTRVVRAELHDRRGTLEPAA